jgi:hypothetical protein
MTDELEEYDEDLFLDFFHFLWKQKDGQETLDKFIEKFGSVGELICAGTVYSPKYHDDDMYDMDTGNESDYKNYYEAMKKSLKEKKDCLFDLVKDRKKVLNPNVEY